MPQQNLNIDNIEEIAKSVAGDFTEDFCNFLMTTNMLDNIKSDLMIKKSDTQGLSAITTSAYFFIRHAIHPIFAENIYAFLTLDVKKPSLLIDSLKGANINNNFNEIFFEYLSSIKTDSKEKSTKTHYSLLKVDSIKDCCLANLMKTLGIESLKNENNNQDMSYLNKFFDCYIREKLFSLYSKTLSRASVYEDVYSRENFPAPTNPISINDIPYLRTIHQRESFQSRKPNNYSHYEDLPFWRKAPISYPKFYSLIEESIELKNNLEPLSIDTFSKSREYSSSFIDSERQNLKARN